MSGLAGPSFIRSTPFDRRWIPWVLLVAHERGLRLHGLHQQDGRWRPGTLPFEVGDQAVVGQRRADDGPRTHLVVLRGDRAVALWLLDAAHELHGSMAAERRWASVLLEALLLASRLPPSALGPPLIAPPLAAGPH